MRCDRCKSKDNVEEVNCVSRVYGGLGCCYPTPTILNLCEGCLAKLKTGEWRFSGDKKSIEAKKPDPEGSIIC